MTENDRYPGFYFYVKDWLDWKVLRMSDAAQGVYIRLLCFAWKDSKDQCSIPNDDKQLARVMRLSPRKWAKIRAEIQMKDSPLFIEEGDRLIHDRLRKMKEEMDLHRRARSNAGKKGAEKRWHKDSNATDLPMAKDNPSLSPSSSSSSNSTRRKEKSSPQGFQQADVNNPPLPRCIADACKRAQVPQDFVAAMLSNSKYDPLFALAWLLTTESDIKSKSIDRPPYWFNTLMHSKKSPPDRFYEKAKSLLMTENGETTLPPKVQKALEKWLVKRAVRDQEETMEQKKNRALRGMEGAIDQS